MYDIESDGSIGPQAITAIVTVDEDPDNFTCPLPTSQSSIFQSQLIVYCLTLPSYNYADEIERTREVLSPSKTIIINIVHSYSLLCKSSGAIAGIAVASTLVLFLLLITATLFIVILLLARKEKKTHPELTWPESAKEVIVRVKARVYLS